MTPKILMQLSNQQKEDHFRKEADGAAVMALAIERQNTSLLSEQKYHRLSRDGKRRFQTLFGIFFGRNRSNSLSRLNSLLFNSNPKSNSNQTNNETKVIGANGCDFEDTITIKQKHVDSKTKIKFGSNKKSGLLNLPSSIKSRIFDRLLKSAKFCEFVTVFLHQGAISGQTKFYSDYRNVLDEIDIDNAIEESSAESMDDQIDLKNSFEAELPSITEEAEFESKNKTILFNSKL
jgi:hypothetical protein